MVRIRERRPIRARGKIKILTGLWVLLLIAGFLIAGTYLWFPSYYWLTPGIVAFAIGTLGARRIWRYANGVRDVSSAWTTRIVMTLGLLVTGFLLFLLLTSTAIADISLLYSSPYAMQSSVVNQAANVGTGFMLNIAALILPLFFGFGAGEAYLIYRLRHHYTISGF